MNDSDKRKPKGYWDKKENCKEEALKYNTRYEFRKGSVGAYNSSVRNGWLDEVCKDMEEIKKPYGHWTIKENCLQESLKYETRGEFYKGSYRAYESSRKNGWLDDICNHMLTHSEVTTKWTYERCRIEALKYETRNEFQKGSNGAYHSSRKNGWLGDICGHMVEVIKPRCHWNIKENCLQESLKYNTRGEFQKESKGSYLSSWKNGWLDEFFPKKTKKR
jgi:hypothetical protein